MATIARDPSAVRDVVDSLRPRLVTIDTARKYMGGVSDRTFYSYRQKYGIRAVRMLENGKPLFDVADLDRAIDAARSAPAEEN